MESTVSQALFFLLLLQIKHVWVDFVSQNMEQVKGKGIYGNWRGITHSIEHAMGTAFILSVCAIIGYPSSVLSPAVFFILPLIDFITHYHIDWAKMNLGCRDMMNEKFWHHLGFDQFAHQVVYLILTVVMFY
jgi:hypothetical protein